MFFIYRRTYTATAGFSSQLDYVCALCGTRAVASVQAQGTATSTAVYGVGGSADQASMAAHGAAQATAFSALQHAPCPRCGGYQPVVTSRFAAFVDRVAKAKKRALPIAAAVAGVALLVGIVPAVRDLRHSSALLVTVVFAALSLFALLYAILRSPGPRPQIPWAAVHFWWARHDGSVGWMPPPHVPPPALPAASSLPALSGVGCGLFAITALVGLGMYGGTFKNVYVVDVANGPIVIDGVDVTKDATTSSFKDMYVRKVSVRTDASHVIETRGQKLTLDPSTAHYGWLVAPGAEKSDVCFAEYEMVYGSSKFSHIEPQANVVELDANGLRVLPRSYDDFFEDSPKTQEVKAGEVKRRWSLRTVSCKKIDEPAAD